MQEEENKTVIVKTFSELIEAEICKAKLNSEGVKCFLEKDNFYGVGPSRSESGVGIKIRVRERDVEKVRGIIKSSNENNDKK